MKVRWFMFGITAALVMSADSMAAYIVTTNMNGADAEVREEDVNGAVPADAGLGFSPGMPKGVNRGTNSELAARAKQSTLDTGDRTSAMYLKFDISDANGITNALLALQDRVPLLLTTRNSAQLKWNRVFAPNPYYGGGLQDNTNPTYVAFRADPANYTRVSLNIYGLTNFSHPRYDWSENGVAATWDPTPGASDTYGPLGSITWYNAPGITPDNRLAAAQNEGLYNFNGDMQLLGRATIEDPGLPSAESPLFPNIGGTGSAALCVGCTAVDFKDTDGLLHDLIEDARLAGKTHITLAVAFGNNAFQNTAAPTVPVTETSQTTPNDMLNFNYLVNPKEMDAAIAGANNQPGRQLNDDPNYNTDWTDVALPLGTADNGLTGPGPNTQILPQVTTPFTPTRYGAQNDDGRFSPQLVFFVPEPSSFVLAALGLLAVAGLTGRRKQIGK